MMDPDTGMARIIFTKSNDWHYEKEWRLIFINSKRLEPYKGKLTGVIFGAKSNEDNKKKITNILEEEVEYFQASLHRTNYGLVTTPELTVRKH